MMSQELLGRDFSLFLASAGGDQLSARSVVLLDDCACAITRRFTLLDGEGQYYFGQFRLLARRILRGVNVNEAYRQAGQELNAKFDWESAFDELLPDFAFPMKTSIGNG